MVQPVSSPLAPETARRTTADVKDAARQFEALLIAQMLKSMKGAEGGWLGTGEDEASSSALEYAQEMLAQSLSAKGGLGLARLVVAGLEAGERR